MSHTALLAPFLTWQRHASKLGPAALAAADADVARLAAEAGAQKAVSKSAWRAAFLLRGGTDTAGILPATQPPDDFLTNAIFAAFAQNAPEALSADEFMGAVEFVLTASVDARVALFNSVRPCHAGLQSHAIVNQQPETDAQQIAVSLPADTLRDGFAAWATLLSFFEHSSPVALTSEDYHRGTSFFQQFLPLWNVFSTIDLAPNQLPSCGDGFTQHYSTSFLNAPPVPEMSLAHTARLLACFFAVENETLATMVHETWTALVQASTMTPMAAFSAWLAALVCGNTRQRSSALLLLAARAELAAHVTGRDPFPFLAWCDGSGAGATLPVSPVALHHVVDVVVAAFASQPLWSGSDPCPFAPAVLEHFLVDAVFATTPVSTTVADAADRAAVDVVTALETWSRWTHQTTALVQFMTLPTATAERPVWWLRCVLNVFFFVSFSLFFLLLFHQYPSFD